MVPGVDRDDPEPFALEGVCGTADGLWETYRDANIAADHGS
ncbi:hypothetical protein [Streptomyces sp. NPDC005538]